MQNGIGQVSTQFFDFPSENLPFLLQNGDGLDQVRLAYETYGQLNSQGDNAILVFHALTGSQHAAGWNPSVEGVERFWNEECQTGWWDQFIGPGRALDTEQHFVICVNYLGGCYGSTGPPSQKPDRSGKLYAAAFPQVTFADIVNSQVALINHLGIQTLHAVTGASIGGMMCLILATRYPERVKNVIPIGSGVELSPLQKILNLEQIRAIEGDPNFRGGHYTCDIKPDWGMAFARMISHKTFVSLDAMRHRARQEVVINNNDFEWYNIQSPLESYMLYHGEKFVARFDANAYLRILDAWQKFDLLANTGAGCYSELFRRCQQQNFLIFSIDSDVCFYPEAQKQMVDLLQQAQVPTTWLTVHSDKGHDSFLVDPDLFAPHIRYQLNQ